MVRAYEMESQTARFPRVIVDPAVIRLARRHRNEDHTPADEEGYVRGFMAEDDDGQLFIDYVSLNAVVAVAGANDDGYPGYLATLSRLLRTGLAHADSRVAEKYLWLHPRYLAALEVIRSQPEDGPYRRENPENCAAIEGLPRLISRARACRARVEEAARSQRRLSE